MLLVGVVERFMGGVAYYEVTLPDGRVLEGEAPESLVREAGLRERRRFLVLLLGVPDRPAGEGAVEIDSQGGT